MPSAAIALPPPLREGDRLSSEEFLHRWSAMPELRHAELIGGIVFLMASPVSRSHGSTHMRLCGWLDAYADATEGVEGGSDATWLMGGGHVPQPDSYLRILPSHGGQSRDDGDYNAGAPELALEVSGSAVSRDLGVKLDLYRSHGVREYLSVILHPRQVIWRQLVRGRYREVESGEDGVIRSRAFPGLWLNPSAIWNPRHSLRTALERGLKSPEHAAFLEALSAKQRRLSKSR